MLSNHYFKLLVAIALTLVILLTVQEAIATAPLGSSLESATRSYIAWGLALQAKDDIQAACR